MKKEDKRGRMDRDVDKKIPRKIVVQIEKNSEICTKTSIYWPGVNCNPHLDLAQ